MLGTLVGLIGPLAIKGVIQGVEKAFGSKQGPAKKAGAVAALAGMASQLVAQGRIGDLKADDLGELVDVFVQLMNSNGELPDSQAATTINVAGGAYTGTLQFVNGVLVHA